MSIADFEKAKCCGCMACMNICPTKAISASKDIDGFLFPHVDLEKCVDCHLCEKICAFNDKNRDQNIPSKAYSLIHKDKAVLMNSTSGGAFTALSDLVLEKGGIVFGACMDNLFNVQHVEAKDHIARDRMRGSIYVQSDTGYSYSKVKDYLKQGKEVMFVGTPCQVGGLKGYLKKPYKNLLCVEFLCHGVPNNDFFKQHIRYLEKIYSAKAKWYTFRSKKYAWWTHGIEEITFEDGRQKATGPVQAYNSFFHSNVSLRSSCLNCTYRKYERTADITIADFWGIEKQTSHKKSNGTSLLLANTETGISYINSINPNAADMKEIPFENVKYLVATKPAASRVDTEEFWNMLHEKGYAELVNKYIDTSLKKKVRFFTKKCVSKYLKYI